MHSDVFRIRLVVVLILAPAAPAYAAEWREVGVAPGSGTLVYVDDASLSVDHDTVVKGWVKFQYDRPREHDGQKFDVYVAQRMVNCEVNRYWQMDAWGYRNNADPVRLYSTAQEWQTPAPDSDSEIASAVLCNETKSIFGIIWDDLAIGHRLQIVWQAVVAAVGR